MIILGIDPGLDGGLAFINPEAPIELQIMPTITVKESKREYHVAKLVEYMRFYKPDHVFLEKQQSMPGQGVSSMFTIGLGYGILRGVLGALEIPYTLVHPKTWQKVMFQDLPKSDTKAMSLIVCGRLWPKQSWLATPRCKKAHDGLCDAAMIGEYGRRQINVTPYKEGR